MKFNWKNEEYSIGEVANIMGLSVFEVKYRYNTTSLY